MSVNLAKGQVSYQSDFEYIYNSKYLLQKSFGYELILILISITCYEMTLL